MEYNNATITHKANLYHDGKVSSRSIVTATGEMKSLGIMLPGVYHFSTVAAEVMEVLQGRCKVKLADQQEWSEFQAGEQFNVPANSHFEIEVDEILDYICHYGG